LTVFCYKSADDADDSAQSIPKGENGRDRFGEFLVSCDLSLAERFPAHSVGADERRGCEDVNDSSREGILIPRERGGTSSVTSVTSFVSGEGRQDFSFFSSNHWKWKSWRSLVDTEGRSVKERGLFWGTFQTGNGRPLGMH